MDKDSTKTMDYSSPARNRDDDLNTSTSERSSASVNSNRYGSDNREPGRLDGSDTRTSSDEHGLTEVTETVREDGEESTSEYPAEFEAKYQQQDLLGKGGCGSVFAGFRKVDNLPVAIKHVPNDKIHCKHNGISVEVAVMLKLADTTDETSAPVSLLDWYKLDQELILVLERPIPAKDLRDHINTNGGTLHEDEAKVILKQLIDAAIYLEEKKIFHRDIKPENILIETSSEILRVRLIDFGLSCFFRKRSCYCIFFGTEPPPEHHYHGSYRAGPTTTFQMGLVLFNTLHHGAFVMTSFYANRQRISNKLSKNCQDFLRTSLNRDPKQRPTLKQLRSHPWL